MTNSTKILVLDGSLGSESGNTAQILAHFETALGSKAIIKTWNLKSDGTPSAETLAAADAFVFSTGTYWDSWGSPMQKFFEDVTHLEGADCFLGKPAALMTTMHSVGGKEVLNRLHGVLNSFGLFIPPMCGFTYSFANHLALRSPIDENDKLTSDFADDLWRMEDLETLAQNLLLATELTKTSRSRWATWLIDREDPNRRWLQPRPNSRQ